KSNSSVKYNLLVPIPDKKQHFDVEYNYSGIAGINIYLVMYRICLYYFDFNDSFAIVTQVHNNETHLIGIVKEKYHETSGATHWISIAQNH
ncbi:45873_t:CDS:2, partial [Gigaspora margarita]